MGEATTRRPLATQQESYRPNAGAVVKNLSYLCLRISWISSPEF